MLNLKLTGRKALATKEVTRASGTIEVGTNLVVATEVGTSLEEEAIVVGTTEVGKGLEMVQGRRKETVGTRVKISEVVLESRRDLKATGALVVKNARGSRSAMEATTLGPAKLSRDNQWPTTPTLTTEQ